MKTDHNPKLLVKKNDFERSIKIISGDLKVRNTSTLLNENNCDSKLF